MDIHTRADKGKTKKYMLIFADKEDIANKSENTEEEICADIHPTKSYIHTTIYRRYLSKKAFMSITRKMGQMMLWKTIQYL